MATEQEVDSFLGSSVNETERRAWLRLHKILTEIERRIERDDDRGRKPANSHS